MATAELVAVSFCDPDGSSYGHARVQSRGGNAEALALLADETGEVVATEPGADPPTDGAAASADGIVIGPERVDLRGDGGGFELALTREAKPVELGLDAGAALWASLLDLDATIRIGGSERRARCRGVRWRLAGAADQTAWVRTLWAALDDGRTVLAAALRPDGVPGHGAEPTAAALLEDGGDASPVTEPFLSTEYDRAGVHSRATLELWSGDPEQPPRRGGGERLRGGTVATARVRLDAACFGWRFEGAAGPGAYEIASRL